MTAKSKKNRRRRQKAAEQAAAIEPRKLVVQTENGLATTSAIVADEIGMNEYDLLAKISRRAAQSSTGNLYRKTNKKIGNDMKTVFYISFNGVYDLFEHLSHDNQMRKAKDKITDAFMEEQEQVRLSELVNKVGSVGNLQHLVDRYMEGDLVNTSKKNLPEPAIDRKPPKKTYTPHVKPTGKGLRVKMITPDGETMYFPNSSLASEFLGKNKNFLSLYRAKNVHTWNNYYWSYPTEAEYEQAMESSSSTKPVVEKEPKVKEKPTVKAVEEKDTKSTDKQASSKPSTKTVGRPVILNGVDENGKIQFRYMTEAEIELAEKKKVDKANKVSSTPQPTEADKSVSTEEKIKDVIAEPVEEPKTTLSAAEADQTIKEAVEEVESVQPVEEKEMEQPAQNQVKMNHKVAQLKQALTMLDQLKAIGVPTDVAHETIAKSISVPQPVLNWLFDTNY